MHISPDQHDTNDQSFQPFIMTKDAMKELVSSVFSNVQRMYANQQTSHRPAPVLSIPQNNVSSYRKELQYKFANQGVYMFTGSNYIPWRASIMADAQIIEASHIIQN